jgi:N-acetylneuraminic acid mutarotase
LGLGIVRGRRGQSSDGSGGRRHHRAWEEGAGGAGALFDWAEHAYPQFFPSHRSNAVLAPYTYRYYPETGNYLGVDGDTVAVLGPISGGSILVVGRVSDFGCRVYPVDCLSNHRFTPVAAPMTAPRAMHTATLLADGTVLIAGGFSAAEFPAAALNTAELYDPGTGAFTALASRMRSPRTQHAAVRLPDGQVLITGGQADTNDGNGVDTAELYDPATRAFSSLAAPMKSPRGGHTATLLNDGKVVLMGGFYKEAGTLKSHAELYDPVSRSFSALTALMGTVRASHRSALLPNGRVLVTGGTGGSSSTSAIVDVELYDPLSKTFSTLAARTTSGRAGHEAISLPGGAVVLIGGTPNFTATGGPVLDSTEVFDSKTMTFAPLPSTMGLRRAGPAGVLLPDGTVLITGGGDFVNGGFAIRDNAERFGPP